MSVQFRDDPHGDRFFALRTYRRDGSLASTPIWLQPGRTQAQSADGWPRKRFSSGPVAMVVMIAVATNTTCID